MKRSFDLLSSLIGLVILMPLLIIISLLILITMPGPIFFTQNRVGKNAKMFKLFKFRTMIVQKGTEKGSFDAGNQSRITAFGKFLRKYKLDELPQLINVLLGSMSIVGPRPEVEKWTKIYPLLWAKALMVKPGITDNASIYFRNEEEILAKSINPEETYKNEILPIKLQYYISYVENNSFWGDILIIFRTFKQIIIK